MGVEIERKWHLVDGPDLERLAACAMAPTRIEQHYLDAPDGTEERVRHLSRPDGERFVHTIKRDIKSAGVALVREEIERDITESQYLAVIEANTHVGGSIMKDRWRFTYAGRCFELDQFHAPDVGWVLELEFGPDDSDGPISLPLWLGEVVEVSTDPHWRNAALARQGADPPP